MNIIELLSLKLMRPRHILILSFDVPKGSEIHQIQDSIGLKSNLFIYLVEEQQ